MKLKDIARRVPGVRRTYRAIYNLLLRMRSTEDVFTDIYKKNRWYGTESVSGLGSESSQTQIISRAIPELIVEYGIRTVHDIPCGDFFWMSRIDLGEVDYLGSDIVGELIEANQARHANPRIRFAKADLLRDSLARVDLMLVRDCLVHLSNQDILQALGNICASESTYLLSTTFPTRNRNRDIPTGRWRAINLQAPPFDLPPPLRLINEGCTEGRGTYSDKSLGLWRIEDIRKTMHTAGEDRAMVSGRASRLST